MNTKKKIELLFLAAQKAKDSLEYPLANVIFAFIVSSYSKYLYFEYESSQELPKTKGEWSEYLNSFPGGYYDLLKISFKEQSLRIPQPLVRKDFLMKIVQEMESFQFVKTERRTFTKKIRINGYNQKELICAMKMCIPEFRYVEDIVYFFTPHLTQGECPYYSVKRDIAEQYEEEISVVEKFGGPEKYITTRGQEGEESTSPNHCSLPIEGCNCLVVDARQRTLLTFFAKKNDTDRGSFLEKGPVIGTLKSLIGKKVSYPIIVLGEYQAQQSAGYTGQFDITGFFRPVWEIKGIGKKSLIKKFSHKSTFLPKGAFVSRGPNIPPQYSFGVCEGQSNYEKQYYFTFD